MYDVVINVYESGVYHIINYNKFPPPKLLMLPLLNF